MRWMAPHRTITAAVLLLAASRVQAETASQIVDRHIKALGGARAVRSVSTLRLLGTTGEGGEFVWQTRAPASFYLEIRQGDRRTVEAVNGTTAWRDDSTGPRTLTGREQARLRALGLYRNDHFLTYKKDKTRVRLLGTETVEGRPAHVLEVITATGIARKVLFDAQTYRIVKEEQELDGGTEELLFADYRPVDGVPEPHLIRIRRGGQTVELTVRQAAHNAQVEAVVFAFPRHDTAPFPDVAVLFQQLEDNQEKLEKAQSDYTYTRTENDLEIDAQGRVKEKSERTYEVFHLGDRPVEKLVARSGRPLPPDEAKKEQERVEKVVRDHQKKVAEGKDKKDGAKNEDEMTVSQILRVCQFVNPRREPFRGRDRAPGPAAVSSPGSRSWWAPSGSTRRPRASCGWRDA
jgi:hypothetical protein